MIDNRKDENMVSINFIGTAININTQTSKIVSKKEELALNDNTKLDGFVKSTDNKAQKQGCWGFKETKHGIFAALVEEKNGKYIITITRANGKDVLETEINIKFKSEKDACDYLNKQGYTTEMW